MNKKNGIKKVVLSVFIVLVIAAIGYYGYYKLYASKLGGYVTVEINPSVQLAISKERKVISVIPINSDADKLIAGLNLIGMTLEEASNLIVDNAISMGYINELSSENVIVIETTYDNAETEKNIQNLVLDGIDKHLKDIDIYALIAAKGLTQELKDKADQLGISYGKMLMIERAISINPELTVEQLSTQNIEDIEEIIEKYVEDRHDALELEKEDLEEQLEKEKEQMIEAHKEELEKAKEDLYSEHQEEIDAADTEEEAEEIKTEILDELRINMKESVESLKQEIEKEDEADKGNGNYRVTQEKVNEIKEEWEIEED